MTASRTALTIPEAAADSVADHVRLWGARGVETGGFLLAPQTDPCRVTEVALTGAHGILRRRYQFGVSGPAFEQLDAWCDERDEVIAAQFHSHARGAFLSEIDKASGYRIEGFTSVVVPNFVDPKPDPTAWGWWRFTQGSWVRLTAPAASPGAATGVVTFDEGGAT